MADLCYAHSLEHIYDEMLLVDLQIHAAVLEFRAQNQKDDNQLKGLFISEEEIDEILKGTSANLQWVSRAKSPGKAYNQLRQAIERFSAAVSKKIEASLAQGIRLNLIALSAYYCLSPKEMEILSICLAHEIDTKYAKLFAYLQNDVTRKNPSVELLLKLTCATFEERIGAREYFSAQSPLFKNHILEFVKKPSETAVPLLLKEVKMNERSVGFLLDSRFIDDKLANLSRLYQPAAGLEQSTLPSPLFGKLKNFVGYFLQNSGSIRNRNFVFALYGRSESQKEELAAAVCYELKIPLLVLDLAALYHSGISPEEGLDLAFRESRILPAALFIKHTDSLFRHQSEGSSENAYLIRYFLKSLNEQGRLVFLESEEPLRIQGQLGQQQYVEIELSTPPYAERKRLWTEYLQDKQCDGAIDIKELAGKYNLTGEQIRMVVATAATSATWRSPVQQQLTYQDLVNACHLHSNQRLADLAQHIRPHFSWQDIILPADTLELLKEVVNMVRYKHIVFEEWGFEQKLSLGKGISVLFYGEPGTGKTMAGEIIAHELGMDLYKIDISTVVSKYIGETEKNLNKIFTEAETSNAILFFDEADALFGKRTEVRDSHDRYANIEVSYLLQKIDEYRGIVILATNYYKNIDAAFERRLHFAINFPFPDESSRRRIWEHVFPAALPRSEQIDCELLAKKLKISGGNIKNIALAAAFYAAEAQESVTMAHISKAAKREYEKIGRLWEDLQP